MCGLVGCAGNLQAVHGKVFSDMLIMDTVRGKDSTGVVHVPLHKYNAQEQPEPTIEKEVGFPDNLWELNYSDIFDYKGFIQHVGRCYIGHNRAATLGKINVANAHPFQFGHVYGAHNGSLRDYRDLAGYNKHEVDSMCIFDHISQHGIADMWKNFTGAAALTWWDSNTQTLNIIRNTERPLWQAFNEKGDVMFWASEQWMISAAAARRQVKLKTEKDQSGKDVIQFRYFETDHHYQWEVANNGIKALPREKLEKKTIPSMANTNYSGTSYAAGASGVGFRGKNTKKYTVSSGKRRRRQLNQSWGQGSKKAHKRTRDLKFEITHSLEGGLRFLGRIISDDPEYNRAFIKVFANNQEDSDKISAAIKNGNAKFKSEARLRYKERGNSIDYLVSSSNIKPVVNSADLHVAVDNDKPRESWGEFVGRVMEENKEEFTKGFIPSYKGELVSPDEWRDRLAQGEGGSCCIYCGDPLDIDEAEELLWVDKNNALCKSCVAEPAAISTLAALYPDMDLSETKVSRNAS